MEDSQPSLAMGVDQVVDESLAHVFEAAGYLMARHARLLAAGDEIEAAFVALDLKELVGPLAEIVDLLPVHLGDQVDALLWSCEWRDGTRVL